MYYIKKFNVTIIGVTKTDIMRVVDALVLLQKSDRVWFNKLSCLKFIIINQKWEYYIEVSPTKKTIICQRGTVRESTTLYLASLIVHEIAHCMFYKKGRNNVDWHDEPSAYNIQINFLKKHRDFYNARYVARLLKEKYWENQTSLILNSDGSFGSPIYIYKYREKVLKKFLQGEMIKINPA